MAGIDIDYLNPAVTGLEETFAKQLNCVIERVGLGLMENNQALHPVSGIIGVQGKGVIGTVVLSMSESVAIQAATAMFQGTMTFTEVDDDVMDAVGELTNMVCGITKARLEQFQLQMSLPNVICGSNCRLHFPQNSHPISMPFKCEWGPMALQIGFNFAGSAK